MHMQEVQGTGLGSVFDRFNFDPSQSVNDPIKSTDLLNLDRRWGGGEGCKVHHAILTKRSV